MTRPKKVSPVDVVVFFNSFSASHRHCRYALFRRSCLPLTKVLERDENILLAKKKKIVFIHMLSITVHFVSVPCGEEVTVFSIQLFIHSFIHLMALFLSTLEGQD